MYSVFKECYRILKSGGVILSGLDNGINYLFDDDEKMAVNHLPFDPLTNQDQYHKCLEQNWGIQFSHTIEEQIGSQLEAGFCLTNLYEDTNGSGYLHDLNVKTFIATRCIKLKSKYYEENI